MLCSSIAILSGCGNKPGFRGVGKGRKTPRIRMSCYATSTVGTTYADYQRLGEHSYKSGKGEQNGMIYTCKGGHIDIAHLHKGADWTAFLAERTLQQLMANKTTFSFKLYEPSKYFVQVEYPELEPYMSSLSFSTLPRSRNFGSKESRGRYDQIASTSTLSMRLS